jgi:hypothetical protein
MPTPPDWLLPLLREFPLFTLVGITVWLVLRYKGAEHGDEIAREKARHEREIANRQAQHDQHVASLNAARVELDQARREQITGNESEIRRLNRLANRLLRRWEDEP